MAAPSDATKSVRLYTDGSCHGNPGRGGWGAILEYGPKSRELFGNDPQTTNNRMEMMAVIEGLRALRESCQVEVWTDSRYIVDGMTSWLAGWKARSWKTASRQPVKNEDLWRELDTESQRHEVSWNWVKGHAGHEQNERCDRLANDAIAEIEERSSKGK